jgi:hypothetical protein
MDKAMVGISSHIMDEEGNIIIDSLDKVDILREVLIDISVAIKAGCSKVVKVVFHFKVYIDIAIRDAGAYVQT